MSNVVKAVEAGVLLGAVTTLLLVGCGGGGGGSSGSPASTVVSNAFVSALTDGVGLRRLSLSASPVVATISIATAGASGSYMASDIGIELNGNTWQTRAQVVTDYFLNSSGVWYDNTSEMPFTPNSDGTITVDGDKLTMVAVDLSGVTIKTGASYRLVNPAIAGGSAVINVGAMPISSASAVYPAGSTSWITTGLVYLTDQYHVGADSTQQIKTPTANLTALDFAGASTFTLSNPLCLPGEALVYSATQPATANTARYDVYLGSCAAVAGTATKWGTVDLAYKTVLTQSVAQFANYTGALAGVFTMSIGGVVYPAVVAVVNGGVWFGYMTPAGTATDVMSANVATQTGWLNKTAMDAVTTAAGLQNF
ncbi:MAG: hypothetical protein HZB47_15230 [Nitrosomonadales bacterium]|nr:hypothetical protein [Nitrosomonadales bacterium]